MLKKIEPFFKNLLRTNHHSLLRRLICKYFHIHHHEDIRWDTGRSFSYESHCDYCDAYVKPFAGGACVICNSKLKWAAMVNICHVCRIQQKTGLQPAKESTPNLPKPKPKTKKKLKDPDFDQFNNIEW